MYACIGRIFLATAFFLALAGAADAADTSHGTDIERTFTASKVRAEFDELHKRLEASHFDLYARRSKPDYDLMFQTMRASIHAPMGLFEIQNRFQKFLAYGRIAHANIEFPMSAFAAYRRAGGKVMPLYIRVVDGIAYVTDNDSGLDAISLGDQIITIDGQSMAAALDRLTRHISADNQYMADTLLEPLFPAMLWLESGSIDSFNLSVRNSAGEVHQIRVPARSRPEMQAAAGQQPKSVSLDWDKREARISDTGVAYLRPGPFYNNEEKATNSYDVAPFSAFLSTAFSSFLAAHCKALVIDLRDNPGGDNSFSDLMVSRFADKPYRFASEFWVKTSQAAIENNRKRIELAPQDKNTISTQLAAAYAKRKIGDIFSFDIPLAYPRKDGRFDGKVFILINRHTYSNAVMVAALAQDYRFATIVGEETSDLGSTYGAMEQFALSRTGIVVNFPKAHIVRPDGNTEARGVVPDVAIETPIVEGVADTGLARALEIAAKDWP